MIRFITNNYRLHPIVYIFKIFIRKQRSYLNKRDKFGIRVISFVHERSNFLKTQVDWQGLRVGAFQASIMLLISNASNSAYG